MLSSAVKRHVAHLNSTNVPAEHIASIFRVES
jgi:hypothetical protein